MALNKMTEQSNLKWLDPETEEVVCTWNDCRENFEQHSGIHHWVFEKTKPDGVPVELTFYYHVCSLCKRTIQSKTDITKSKAEYRDFKAKSGEWLPSTDKERIAISKIQTEMIRKKNE